MALHLIFPCLSYPMSNSWEEYSLHLFHWRIQEHSYCLSPDLILFSDFLLYMTQQNQQLHDMLALNANGGKGGENWKSFSSPLGICGYYRSAAAPAGKGHASNRQVSPQLCLLLNLWLLVFQHSHQWPLGSPKTGTSSPAICRVATAHSYHNEPWLPEE